MRLKNAFKFGQYLLVLYVVVGAILRLVVRETDIWYFAYYLIFGIPALVSYFLLVLLYDKTTRKVFGMIVGVGIVVIGGWLFYELIYWPYKYR